MPFEKGHKLAKGGARPGSGRKPEQAREAACAALDGITSADLTAIVRRAVSLAKEGDVRAIGLIFDRLLGKAASADVAEIEDAVRAEAGKFQAAVMAVLTEDQKRDVLAQLQSSTARA